MKTIELSEVAALTPHVQPGSDEPVILVQNGKTIAAILPAGEDDLEDLLLSINPQFNAILQRSQSRLQQEGGVPAAEVRRQLGLPTKESRQ